MIYSRMFELKEEEASKFYVLRLSRPPLSSSAPASTVHTSSDFLSRLSYLE